MQNQQLNVDLYLILFDSLCITEMSFLFYWILNLFQLRIRIRKAPRYGEITNPRVHTSQKYPITRFLLWSYFNQMDCNYATLERTVNGSLTIKALSLAFLYIYLYIRIREWNRYRGKGQMKEWEKQSLFGRLLKMMKFRTIAPPK